MQNISKQLRDQIRQAMRNEKTEYHVYSRLARKVRNSNNSKVLAKIGADELRHYNIFKEFIGEDVRPSYWKIIKFYLVARLFGLTFGIKLMERGEAGASVNYMDIGKDYPEAIKIAHEEEEHEQMLINMIDEERMKYIGSVVLGLSDALVELTGALAGFTLAIQNNKVIAMLGLITGISASLSMGASEYLSIKHENDDRGPFKGMIYTGGMYLIVVLLLIVPFLLLGSPVYALLTTLTLALGVVWIFTYYTSVAQDLPFFSRFFEMAGLSLIVSLISFGMAYVVKTSFGIEI